MHSESSIDCNDFPPANCSFEKGDVEKARELYNVALENDASCVEALYNLGLCNKKLALYEDALECFFKLQTIVRNHAEVRCVKSRLERQMQLAIGIEADFILYIHIANNIGRI